MQEVFKKQVNWTAVSLLHELMVHAIERKGLYFPHI